jgi:hypothetical protein
VPGLYQILKIQIGHKTVPGKKESGFKEYMVPTIFLLFTVGNIYSENAYSK